MDADYSESIDSNHEWEEALEFETQARHHHMLMTHYDIEAAELFGGSATFWEYEGFRRWWESMSAGSREEFGDRWSQGWTDFKVKHGM